MKITLFVANTCPDCPPAIEAFKNSGLEYELIDINENMPNLKKFLHYRDRSPFFDDIKENGSVGVPTIMLGDGEKFIEYSSDLNLKELKN